MYSVILFSTVAVSFALLVALFAFRAWELKEGRISPKQRKEPIAPRVYESRHVVKRWAFMIIWFSYRALRNVWRWIRRVASRHTGMRKVRGLVTGKREVEQNGGGSLYLKDISVHKQRTANGNTGTKEKEEGESKTSKNPE